MNRTSRGCRLVRMAARSPARSMTGPEVALIPRHLLGDDVGQGGLAQSRGTVHQYVVHRLPPGPGRLHGDFQIAAHFLLAHELGQTPGPEPGLQPRSSASRRGLTMRSSLAHLGLIYSSGRNFASSGFGRRDGRPQKIFPEQLDLSLGLAEKFSPSPLLGERELMRTFQEVSYQTS